MNDQLVHQLVLLDDDDDRQWRLDERTRDVGRRGVALAREALCQAAPRAA